MEKKLFGARAIVYIKYEGEITELAEVLNDKFELGLAWGEMHHYAKQIGSDCSFFISNRPSFVEGKGDEFESIQLDLSKYYIALIYPNIHINTAKAYSGVKPKKASRSLEADLLTLPIVEWKNYIHNDFEDSIFPQFPELKNIKEKLYEKPSGMPESDYTDYLLNRFGDAAKEIGRVCVAEGDLK